MDIETIKQLNQSTARGDAAGRAAALARLGNPAETELVELGMTGLRDPDRNIRVQMVRLLWTLSHADRGAVTEAMLRALGDPTRRVRRLAAHCCLPVSGDSRIEVTGCWAPTGPSRRPDTRP